MKGSAYELGKKGERLSCKYLIKRGYVILDSNFRCRLGEIDIIAKKDEKLIFIEVKTRSSLDFGEPIDFILRRQVRHMTKAMSYYIKVKNLEGLEIQVDAIEILFKDEKWYIRHTENIF